MMMFETRIGTIRGFVPEAEYVSVLASDPSATEITKFLAACIERKSNA